MHSTLMVSSVEIATDIHTLSFTHVTDISVQGYIYWWISIEISLNESLYRDIRNMSKGKCMYVRSDFD